MNIERYLSIAAGVAMRDDGRTYQLGAVGLRRDGALVAARNARTEAPNRQAHAEYRLSRKLDGGTVFVARVMRDGCLALARPCINCQKILRSKKVDRVYYSISNNEYGCLIL